MAVNHLDLLIVNGSVVTMDAPRTVIPDGYVAVRGSRIVAVGPMSECPPPGGSRVIDGARAIGMDDDIGSLEVGKKADVILVDLDGAHMTPRQSIASAIVYQANGTEVRTSVINGQIVMENRVPSWLDSDSAASARIIADAGLPTRSDAEWASTRTI